MKTLRNSAVALLLAAAITTVTSSPATSTPIDSSQVKGAELQRYSGPLDGVGALKWGECSTPTLEARGAECASLEVPLDYAKPDGKKIKLAVSRIKHTVPDDQYQGIMLVNPGGPGGSGLIYSILGGFVPGDVGKSYDWIGFDPRGIGDSEPRLSCVPDYNKAPRPDPVVTKTPGAEQAWLKKTRDYAQACRDKGGDLIDHMKTIDSVNDMHAIRQALGEEKLSFYGFSYGTYLAQVYASTYPKSIHRMVLDSSVDPRNIWYKANINQNDAFEKVFQEFFAWVARYDEIYHLGKTGKEVEAKYYAALDKLRKNPMGTLGPAELPDAYLPAGYAERRWPQTASAFAALVNDGDAKPSIELYESGNDATDDNSYAGYVATECTDAWWPSFWPLWKYDAIRGSRRAPYLTWSNMWFNAPCMSWKAMYDYPVPVRDRGAPPMLIIGETLDGATPYAGNVEVRRRFKKSVLIGTDGGASHATSLFAGNECVDIPVANYLRDGSLPARVPGSNKTDVMCKAMPKPVPDELKDGGKERTARAAATQNSVLQELHDGIITANAH